MAWSSAQRCFAAGRRALGNAGRLASFAKGASEEWLADDGQRTDALVSLGSECHRCSSDQAPAATCSGEISSRPLPRNGMSGSRVSCPLVFGVLGATFAFPILIKMLVG